MKKPMYSIYDEVAGFFSPVFLAENNGHAIRMMQQSIDINHKADFALYIVGQFDDQNGEITETGSTLVLDGRSLQNKDAS